MAADTKATLRAALSAARRAVPDDVRAAEARQLAGHLDDVVRGALTVCAYVPVGTEPGSPEMLDRLLELGATVLLPVARTGPMHWGRYTPGTLVPGRWGLLEPPEPWLAPDAVAGADVVLVPALAVDRAGVRLGRGGGYYDRTLALCDLSDPSARLVAVVRDDERVNELPCDPHDVRVTHVLTPSAGLVALPG